MHRKQVVFGVLGLMLAAATVRADTIVKVLGQSYSVTMNPRTGTFKNGVTVNLQKGGGGVDDATVAKKANLAFVLGADASGSQDRLFVVAAHQDDPGPTSDGLYILTGTDAKGVFSPAASDATVLLRGNKEVHGRFQNITFLNDSNATPGKNRNLYGMTFTTTNMLRWMDLGALMTGAPHTEDSAFRKLSSFVIREPSDTEQTVPPDPDNADLPNDDNAPDGTYDPGALAPNGMMIIAGNDSVLSSVALGVIDPLKGTKFFPVKTDLAKATANKYNSTEWPHTFVHLTGDEYLMMSTDPDGGINADETALNSQTLYHLKITLPADLTKDAPDSIQVEVLGTEDLPALNLGQSPTHKMYGLAIGREVSPGKPILYMADWAGNLFTLRPTP